MRTIVIIFQVGLLSLSIPGVGNQTGEKVDCRQIVLDLNAVAQDSLDSNPSMTKNYLDSALEISLRIDFHEGIAFTYSNLGDYYSSIYSLKKADSVYHLALKVDLEFDDLRSIGQDYNRLAAVSYSLGNYTVARQRFDSAYYFFGQVGDSSRMSGILSNIASTYTSQGRYDQSVVYLLRALDFYISEDDYDHFSTSFNLGVVYFYLKDFDRADAVFKRLLNLHVSLGNKEWEALVYNEIGNIKTEIQECDSAIYYHQNGYNIWEEVDDKGNIAMSLQNLGNAYYCSGEYKKAIPFYLKSIENKETIGDLDGKAISLGNLGIMYFELREYLKAVDYLDSSQSIAETVGNTRLRLTNYSYLSETYDKMNDHEEALKKYKQFSELNDSIFRTDKVNEIKVLEQRFDLDKQSLEIDFLNSQKDLDEAKIRARNTFLLLIGLVLLAVMVVAYFLWRLGRLRKLSNQKLAASNQQISEQNLLIEKDKALLTSKNSELDVAYEAVRQTYVQSKAYFDQSIFLSEKQVRIKDIKFISVKLNDTHFELMNSKEVRVSNFSMRKALDQLPDNWFVQINRNEAVNLDLVKAYRGDFVILLDNMELKVSEKYKGRLRQVMKE